MVEFGLLVFAGYVFGVRALQLDVLWGSFTFGAGFLGLSLLTDQYGGFGLAGVSLAGLAAFGRGWFFWGATAVAVHGGWSATMETAATAVNGWLTTGDDLRTGIVLLTLLGGLAVVFTRQDYTYEYVLIVVVLTLSSLILLKVDDLVLLYLNFELQGLTLYTLVTYHRFEETNTESGLKYLLVGSVMGCFFLVGILFQYFDRGSTRLDGSANGWVVLYFLYKLGAAPLHFWTPTVYQSLDLPGLIWVSTLPKLTAWSVWLELVDFNWWTYLAGLTSIGVGALGGVYQLSIGSIMAYSGVLNNGYLLVLADHTHYVWVYLLGYHLTSAVLLTGLSFDPRLVGWRALGRYYPFWGYYLLVSVGGLPVVPGFNYKWGLLAEAVSRSLAESAAIVLGSLFGLVYYLRVTGRLMLESSSFDQPKEIPYGYALVMGLTLVSVGFTLL